VKEDEINEACSTHGREERCILSFGKGIDGGIILKWILQNRIEVCELGLSCSIKDGAFHGKLSDS
jgi:hypothetical protein